MAAGATAARGLINGIRPLVAFVLGGPGSGKGTQCKLICEEFGFKHLSAGDLLRAERSSPGSKYGEMIEKHIREGTIVPVEVTCSLLERAMIEHCKSLQANGNCDVGKKDIRGKFLVDGFPRNDDNLQGWTKQIGDRVEVMFVLFLDCPQDICVQRCLKRGQHGSNRSDDNVESLRKRLTTYSHDTMPIIEYYKKLNQLKQVDATLSAADVYSEVRRLFL